MDIDDAVTSEATHDPSANSADIAEVISELRTKILHVLEIFPFLSGSMIHMAIGTSTATKLWKPIVEGLVQDGTVVQSNRSYLHPVSGRLQPYTIYHLASNRYVFGPSLTSDASASESASGLRVAS
jgi:hypothetical protein